MKLCFGSKWFRGVINKIFIKKPESRAYPFSTYAKFPPPDMHTYVCVLGGKELVFVKFCVGAKCMIL